MEFSKWWVNEFKTIKFPSHGTVFDYCIDRESKKFAPWTEKVPTFKLDPELPLQVNIWMHSISLTLLMKKCKYNTCLAQRHYRVAVTFHY